MELRFLFFLGVLICILDVGYSKRLEGSLKTDEKWAFLTRFCFLHKLGGMTFDVSYPKKYGTQRLLFYYDTPGQWSYVYKRGKSCEEKADVAKDGGNFFTLGTRDCSTINDSRGEEWFRCRANLDFHSARERWWYLALERCDAPTDPLVTGLRLKYRFHLTNGDDLLHKEFSADQFYILPINIVFFILYIIMLVISIVVAVILKKKTLYHTTYAMFLAAISIWTVSLLFLVIAWGSYANSGWERSSMEVFGRLLQSASNIIFMLMLILMAKGYTIVRGRLTNKASVKITVFIMLYIAITITLFVWEAQEFDEGLVLFYLESPAGYCMVLIQLVGWLWMTKAAVFTLKHHSNTTSRFYIPFYIIFTVWFWLAPIVIMFAIFAMPKWMREKTVHGVLQFVSFAGHLFFLALTRPSKANSNFPYNVKTTQIGVGGGNGEDEGGLEGSGNTYSVNYHTDDFRGTGPNLDIFITSKNNNYSNVQAGYMYPPLEPFMSPFSDSPPPSYPQAMTEDHPETSNSNRSNNNGDGINDNPTLPPSNRLPPVGGQAHGHLPPIGMGSFDVPRETTLPPIRGSGLPAFNPSALPLESTERQEAPPDYSKLFQVK